MKEQREEMPLISVVIPVYNADRYLEKCLDSVIRQTYSNLQIILVDDGSTDNSAQICRRYAEEDRRIQIICQKNQGVSAARNVGIERAEGCYIGFVDADDWIHPDMYRHLLEIMEKYDADISTVECLKTFGEDGCEQEKINIRVLEQEEFAKAFFKIGSQKILYYIWNRLYKREILEKHQFDERFAVGEDVVASYKAIIKADRIAVSNQKMYFYRQMSGVTGLFNDKYFQLIDVWKKVGEITEERVKKYLPYVKINQERIYFTLLTELAVSGGYKNPNYKEQIAFLLNSLKKGKRLLLKSDIAVSRKVLIFVFCLNYRLCAFVLEKMGLARQ